jgi:hypothetical protein
VDATRERYERVMSALKAPAHPRRQRFAGGFEMTRVALKLATPGV